MNYAEFPDGDNLQQSTQNADHKCPKTNATMGASRDTPALAITLPFNLYYLQSISYWSNIQHKLAFYIITGLIYSSGSQSIIT